MAYPQQTKERYEDQKDLIQKIEIEEPPRQKKTGRKASIGRIFRIKNSSSMPESKCLLFHAKLGHDRTMV